MSEKAAAAPAPAPVTVPWWRTDLGEDEIARVGDAIRARRVAQGPLVAELEAGLAERLGVPGAVLTTSGSVALLLALMAHDVGPGDEVIVPALTFIAPAHAVRLLGATVVLADVAVDRPLVDPAAVEAALTGRTRAIVAVHLNGRACPIGPLRAVAERAGVALVEDCAQAFCSRDADGFIGSSASAAAYSLGLTKLMTTGEGGFVTSADDALRERLARLRNHGTHAIADNRFDEPGANFRLTDMQAAVGLAQLEKLDAKIEGVRRVYAQYLDGLAGLEWLRVLEVRTDAGELPLWTEVVCSERDRVAAELGARGIQAKAFHPSLGRSAHLGAPRPMANAEWYSAHGLTLPSGPDQPAADIERTIEALREIGAANTTPLRDARE